MNLQYRVCQPVRILLFSLGLLLGALLGEVCSTNAPATVTESTLTHKNLTSPSLKLTTIKHDVTDHSHQALTSAPVTPSGKTSAPPPKHHSTESTKDKQITIHGTPESHTDRKIPTKESSTDEKITSTVPPQSQTSTGAPGKKESTSYTGVIISCFVLLFVVIISICLYIILRKRRKMSYSLTYSKSPETSSIPLNKKE